MGGAVQFGYAAVRRGDVRSPREPLPVQDRLRALIDGASGGLHHEVELEELAHVSAQPVHQDLLLKPAQRLADLRERHLRRARYVGEETFAERRLRERTGRLHLGDGVQVGEDARDHFDVGAAVVVRIYARLRRGERRDEVEHLIYEGSLFRRNLRHGVGAGGGVAAAEEARHGVMLHVEHGVGIVRRNGQRLVDREVFEDEFLVGEFRADREVALIGVQGGEAYAGADTPVEHALRLYFRISGGEPGLELPKQLETCLEVLRRRGEASSVGEKAPRRAMLVEGGDSRLGLGAACRLAVDVRNAL